MAAADGGRPELTHIDAVVIPVAAVAAVGGLSAVGYQPSGAGMV